MSWTSATQTAGRQGRARPVGIRADVTTWRAGFYRAKGWEMKAPAQKEMQDSIAAGLTRMEQRAAPPGRANGLRRANPQPPPSFQAYMDALAAMEAEAPPRAPQSVDNLRRAAQGHLAAHAKLRPAEQAQPGAAERKQECERKLSELQGYNLRAEFRALGDPPWGSQTAMKAASLQATFDFESLPPDSRVAEKLQGGNANPAFWVNKAGPNGTLDKSFLFKPTAPSAALGFPDGGDSAREALAGRQADLIGAMTGLSFGVPETQIVELGRERFAGDVLDAVQPGSADTPVVGSLQQFAAGGKELRGFSDSMRDKIPVATCQKLAILDTVLLNCDRHAGNLLQTGTEENPDLVPIDHGCCFPGKDQVFQTLSRTGLPGSNALLALPGTHQPFTPDMLAAIDMIDPAAMVRTLGAERDTMAAAHPQTAGKVGDDAIEMSRRAAAFLKLAAPRLSPGTVQFTLGQHRQELFDPALDDAGFTRVAGELIMQAARQQDAIAEFCMMAPGERAAMGTEFGRLGWGDLGTWQKTDLSAAMALVKSGTPRLRDDARPFDFDENTPAEIAEMQAAFPDMKIDPDNHGNTGPALKSWRVFNAYGGRAGLLAAVDALGLRGPARARALADVKEAAAALRDADAVQRARAAAANDPQPWRQEMDFLRTLEAMMPRGMVPTFRGEVQKLDRAAAAGTPAPALAREIRRTKAEALDLIRSSAVAELESLRTPLMALIRQSLQGADADRQEELEEVRKAFEASIIFVQGASFNSWRADRDRFKGYIDAGAIP